MNKNDRKYTLREINCPTGFNWSNIKAELKAVWESNIKDWKIEFAYPVSFIRQMISPLVFLLPFIIYGIVLVGGDGFSENLAQLVGTGDVVSFIVTGYIMMGFIGTAVWAMGFSIRRERWFGTLEAIYITPTSRLVQVFGMAIHSTIHQILGTTIQLIFIYLTFGLGFKMDGILPSLFIFGLMMLALYGFGIVISALGLVLKEGWVVSDILYSTMTILSPVAYPLIVLPTLAQQASALFPTAPALIGMRSFLLENYQIEAFGNIFLHLLILGAAWIIFGVFVFKLADKYVRRRGMLRKF